MFDIYIGNMKINKKIILFTYGYPTGISENTFINFELSKLSRNFNHIEIVPQKNFKKKGIGFKKNKKISINLGLSKQFNYKNLIIVFFYYTIFSKIFYQDLVKIIFKKNFFLKLKMCIVELTKSEIAYHWIMKEYMSKHENLIFYSFWSNYILISFDKIKKLHKIKTISRTLGSDLNGFIKGDDYVPFIDKKFLSLNKLIVLSKIQKLKILKKKLIKKNKLKISPLGIYKNNGKTKLKKNVINFLSCNNLIKIKNNFKMAEFVKFFSQNTKNKVNYFIIGEGEEYKKLKLELDKNNNQFNFKIIKRVSNLQNFMIDKNINFFLNFSEQEGMSFSIMESLGCGIPVISSNISENKILVNKTRGYILSFKNQEKSFLKITKEISKDLNSENLYKIKQANAKKFINQNLINNKCYPKFFNLIKKL